MSSQPNSTILVVTSDVSLRQLLVAALHGEFLLAAASSLDEAGRLLPILTPGLALIDARALGANPYEACRRMRVGAGVPAARVILVSGGSAESGHMRACAMGADDSVVLPLNSTDLCARLRLHLQLREATARAAAVGAEIEARDGELRRLVASASEEIASLQDVAVFTLAKLAESRDVETAGHLSRMRAFSQILAEHLGRHGPYADEIDTAFLDDLYRSSPLHDIGKVGIPDDILLKRGKLTAEEFVTMQQHTIIGANILDQATLRLHGCGFLSMAGLIARFHHEKFDGAGYPAGLVGDEIPLPARIVAVADVYDALCSLRPYKPPFTSDVARKIIEDGSGNHFDPVIVAAFTERFDEFLSVQQHELGEIPESQGAMAFLCPAGM